MLEIKTNEALHRFITQPLQKVVCFDDIIYSIGSGYLLSTDLNTRSLLKKVLVSSKETLLSLFVSADHVIVAGTSIARIYATDSLSLMKELALPPLSCISAITIYKGCIYLSDISCKLFIYDISGAYIDTFYPEKPVSCYASCFYDGKWLIGTAFQELRVFALETRTEELSFSLNRTAIFGISCFNNYIALACEDRSVQVYDISSEPTRIRRWIGYHASRIYGVTWDDTGSNIYSCGEDCAVYEFNFADETKIRSISDLSPEVAISPVSIYFYKRGIYLSLGNSLIYNFCLDQANIIHVPYDPTFQVSQLSLQGSELSYLHGSKYYTPTGVIDMHTGPVRFYDEALGVISYGRYTICKGFNYAIPPVVSASRFGAALVVLASDSKLLMLDNGEIKVLASGVASFYIYNSNIFKVFKSGYVSCGDFSIKLKKPVLLTVFNNQLLCYTKNLGVYKLTYDSTSLRCAKIARYGNITGVFYADADKFIGLDPMNPHKLKIASIYPHFNTICDIDLKIASYKAPVAFSNSHVAIITSDSIAVVSLSFNTIYGHLSCNREILCSEHHLFGTEDGCVFDISTGNHIVLSTGSIRSISRVSKGTYFVTGAQGKMFFITDDLYVISELIAPNQGCRVMCSHYDNGTLYIGDSVGDIWKFMPETSSFTHILNVGNHCVYSIASVNGTVYAATSWGEIYSLSDSSSMTLSKSALYSIASVNNILYTASDDGSVYSSTGLSVHLTNSSLRYLVSHNSYLYALSWDHYIYVLDEDLCLVNKMPHSVYAGNTLSICDNKLMIFGFGYDYINFLDR